MSLIYWVTAIAHQLWFTATTLKSNLRHHVHHRFHYGKLAQPLKKSNLAICKYRWTNGVQYTFVQPLKVCQEKTIICAIIETHDKVELDVSTEITCLAGPHFDFHGSELTLSDVLECLGISQEKVQSLCICIKVTGDYVESVFTDPLEIISFNKSDLSY